MDYGHESIKMIPVKSLELRMSAVIRAGLRKAMHHIDVTNFDDPLREVEQVMESYLYETLRDQILKTYGEGYVHGGHLIRRHKPANMMLTAATPLGEMIVYEDPRIANATKAVIYGLEGSIAGHRNEIQAVIRTQYERGATIPMITKRLEGYFDDDRTAATRFARTITNDVYNRAHLDRYEDSGVVDGVQYSAHIDARTSEICMMLNGTIWALGDSEIRVPPSHHNCRSGLDPYFGRIPSKRDFKAQFGSKFVEKAENISTVFRSKYWSPMPHTKASATLQRAYFDKRDLLTIRDGLNIARKTSRDPVGIDLLKTRIRYRKTDPDKSMIADAFGKSIMLDKFERRQIKDAIHALIVTTHARRDRLLKRGLDTLADAENIKIARYEEILRKR